MKVLVTGGTGFVGRHLVRKLVERGEEVRCLVRRGSAGSAVERMGAEVATGDITHYESVLDAARGIDVVYHCAAKVGVGGVRSEFYLVNVEGTNYVLKACEHAGVGRLVHVSTQSVTFDHTSKHHADESTPYPSRFRDLYSETKALGEREVLSAAKAGRVRAVAIRPTWVWGPGDTTILPSIAKAARLRMLMLLDGGRAKVSTSYVENVCDCLILGAMSEVSGEAFFVTDDEDIATREFLEKMAGAVGFPPPRMSAPYGLVYALAGVAERIQALLSPNNEPLMSRYGIALLGRNLTFSCEKAKRMLGYRAGVSIDEGMQRLKKWVEELGGVAKLIA
ncbi:MAG: SDR family NAD(P)-dependent oxidoreductase [Candidatus Abyssubacteria bacterium]